MRRDFLFSFHPITSHMLCFSYSHVVFQLHADYEREKLLMADVEGWEVGKSMYNSDVWMVPLTHLIKDQDDIKAHSDYVFGYNERVSDHLNQL